MIFFEGLGIAVCMIAVIALIAAAMWTFFTVRDLDKRADDYQNRINTLEGDVRDLLRRLEKLEAKK